MRLIKMRAKGGSIWLMSFGLAGTRKRLNLLAALGPSKSLNGNIKHRAKEVEVSSSSSSSKGL